MARRMFAVSLGTIAVASLICRLAYVGWQSTHDPSFARPSLDGALYVAWARGLASGAGEPAGAFYLAPLYPHLLAGFLSVFGDRFTLLYAVQQAMIVSAGCLLAQGVARTIGEAAALLAASAVLLYHPAVFFASRPSGEPVALVLSALGVYLFSRRSSTRVAFSGIAFGLSALARPNLLLVAGGLALADIARRRWEWALLMAAAAAVPLAPVAIRNYAASGHPVLVSSNGGMTLYHGNGPGALGVFTPAAGFSGTVAHQRDEATILARTRTGLDLDPVGADRWFGREALRTRVRDPGDTVRLLLRRMLLLLDNYEHGLDEAPRLDENPWRFAFPAPFSLLLGLATVGAVAAGFAGTGGAAGWAPIVATAATPIVFYVSSRYRLPMAMFLCVPAGVGAASLFGAARATPSRTRLSLAVATGALVTVGSLIVPSASLARSEEAAAHANRASVFAEARDLPRAEGEARKALVLDPSSVLARYNLAVVLSAGGRKSGAEALYRDALALDPSHAESAGNLAKLLIEQGGTREAVPILERALASRPGDATCWTNLVAAWISLGELDHARRAVADAENAGVQLAPELVEAAGARSDRMGPTEERRR